MRRIASAACSGALALCICLGAAAASADNAATPNPTPQASPARSTPLLGTEWQLVQLGRTPAQREVAASARPPHLVLRSEGNGYEGSSGCNRIFGTYRLAGESLSLAPVAGTKMACPGPLMEQERKLVDALEATTRYRVSGRVLQLFAGNKPLARFESRSSSQGQ